MAARVHLRRERRLEQTDWAADRIARHEAHRPHAVPVDWKVGVEAVGAVVGARRDKEVELGAQELHAVLVLLPRRGRPRHAARWRRQLHFLLPVRHWLEVEQVAGVTPAARRAHAASAPAAAVATAAAAGRHRGCRRARVLVPPPPSLSPSLSRWALHRQSQRWPGAHAAHFAPARRVSRSEHVRKKEKLTPSNGPCLCWLQRTCEEGTHYERCRRCMPTAR